MPVSIVGETFHIYDAQMDTNTKFHSLIFITVDSRPLHWRRQLWGTDARAPLDFQL